MEKIIRSVLQVGNVPESEECVGNWNRLVEHDLDFPNEEDRKIFGYLQQFYGQMAAPPDFSLIRDYFNKQDEIEVVTRLDELKGTQFFIRTNFLSLVRAERERQTIHEVILACRDAQQIAEHGRNLEKPINGKKILRGPQDAINYLFDRTARLQEMDTGVKMEGIAHDDAEEMIEKYELIEKTNQFSGRNLFGLEPVDSVCQGHKSGEFWVHCAYPGELKTSLALNYAYNNAYLYGKSIFYAILEMPYDQLTRQLFVVHSSHGKFVSEWKEEDRKNGFPDQEQYVGLDYRAVRDGTLTPLAKKRFITVAQDFKATCKGKLFVWKPADQVSIQDIRRKGEAFYNKYGCDGAVIDYLGKAKPSFKTTDVVDRINTVVSEARDLALNFVRGRGVPVLGLFQMNRQGKLRADKADGRYDVASISYANRIMEDADVVSYTYLNDELRRQGKFYMGCLKNRDNPPFELMIGKILWLSKRMRALEKGMLDLKNDQAKLRAAVQAVSGMTGDDMLL